MEKNKTGKYFKYAIGEIVLVVVGILIALQINNWNESKKEGRLEQQLIGLLISDLQEKNKENLSDSKSIKNLIKRIQNTVNIWELNSTIDTVGLKRTLRLWEMIQFFKTKIHQFIMGFQILTYGNNYQIV